jgi:predicted Zn-dependent protease
VWKDNDTIFPQNVADAPLSYKAHYSFGMSRFQAGDPVTGEREVQRAIQLYPDDPDVYYDLARQYRLHGLCAPAKAYYRRVMVMDTTRFEARLGLIQCLLQEADFAAARAEARRGYALGRSVGTFRQLAALADSALRAQPRAP